MLQTSPDKRGTILSAAYDVFINYGFRKTSMDDIARAAGMSRPALYQVFRNKTEIFRGLSLCLLEVMARDAREAFNSGKPFPERLFDALNVSILKLHHTIDSTPHGTELMGVNDEVAGDLECEWCDSMVDALAEGLEEARAAGEISFEKLGVEARDVADIIMQAMEGMKADYIRGNPISDKVKTLLTFVSSALTLPKS
jgi:AcrR family transcriptional regulator